MRLFVSKFLMFLLFLLMLIQPVQASSPHKIVDDAQVCTIAAQRMESKYQIKKHLLSTITSVETGRWNPERQRVTSWPWTVNAEGKGYFFETKQEAIAAVKKLQAEGIKSIDVGCMQINLVYHAKAFKSLEEAFNPYKNMEYGAKFLRELYAQKGNDWNKAATAYHSNMPEKAQKYAMKLSKVYRGIIEARADRNPMSKALSKFKNRRHSKLTSPIKSEVHSGRRAVERTAAQKTPVWRQPRKIAMLKDAKKASVWREAKLAAYKAQKELNEL